MNEIEFDLLNKFLIGLKQQKNLMETDFSPEDIGKERRSFYLKDKYNNCFDHLHEKMNEDCRAVRSSAAMFYNTIGIEQIILDGKKYSKIEYEYELPAIDNKDNSDHDHSAHLDVKLEAKDELLFIEAKCMEWLSDPKKLNRAYLSDYCYFDYTGKAVSKFKNAFLCLLKYPQNFHANEKDANYQRYDAVQMTIHILGIYNWCIQNKTSVPKRIILMNIVWNYDCNEYRTEEKEGLEYVGFANLSFRNLFEEIGVYFKVEYVRYSELLSRIDWSNDMERRKYLQRYEVDEKLLDKKDLDLGLSEQVEGYNHRSYTLEQLRETANKYRWDDPQIENIKTKHSKVYNYSEENIPPDLLQQVYPALLKDFKEEWRPIQEWFYAYYNIKNLSYEVSNLGRIRIGKEYLLQDDKEGYHGYLVISKENVEKNPLVKNHSVEIYKFISAAFLGSPADKQIHHIDNNGYDCRPENLILLSPRQHSKAHGFFITGDDRKRHENEININSSKK